MLLLDLASEAAEELVQTIGTRSFRFALVRNLQRKGFGPDAAAGGALVATGRARWLCPTCGSDATRWRRGHRYWLTYVPLAVGVIAAIVALVAAGVILGGDAPTIVAVAVGIAGLALGGLVFAGVVWKQTRLITSEKPRVRCRHCEAQWSPLSYLRAVDIASRPATVSKPTVGS